MSTSPSPSKTFSCLRLANNWCLAALATTTLLIGSPVSLAASEEKTTQEVVTIWSEGVKLEGDLFKPKGLTRADKLPGILLVHGWGGVKKHLNRNYARQFSELGFVVLSFDYKGWGKSNGPLLIKESLNPSEESEEVTVTATHVRKIVNPLSMVEDARAALNYLAGDRNVMRNNIGVWGTSLGGGIALVTAANNPDRINAYVDQIGAVNFQANLENITPQMTRKWEMQRVRGKIGPYPGPESAFTPTLKGYPDWIYMKRYDSFAYVDKLDAPTLIIDAEDEELFARDKNGQVLHAAIKDRLPTKYLAYPGKHYDMYSGENYLNSLSEAKQWFVKHLKGDGAGADLYKTTCAICHSNPDTKAPSFSDLKAMNRERIAFTLSAGKMQAQASALTDDEREAVVNFISTENKDPHAWESAIACSAGPANNISMNTAVGNWGYGLKNHRFQSADKAGLDASSLKDLELAWSIAFPGATEMRSQAVLTEDTIFVGVQALSSVYALDLETGCLKWAHKSSAPLRSSLSFSHLPGKQTPVLFYGDAAGSVHLLDARDGSKIWTAVKDMKMVTITGTPVHHEDKLFVPLSTFEVAAAGRPSHECCQAHGGVRALDIHTGETLWTYHTVEPASPRGKSSVGTQLWGPSGAPVWTTPSIDIKRNQLYIGTGENYSHSITNTSDAIIAIDLDSGKPNWIFQARNDDAYNMACLSYLGYPDGPNCPENSGPDFDFGASVVIAQDRKGQDLLIAGQKSGDVWAIDPDNGKVRWHNKQSDGTPVGGVHWGLSVHKNTVFVPIADPEWPIKDWSYQPQAGVAALDIDTGKTLWRHRAERDCELDYSNLDPKNGKHTISRPNCHFLYGFSGAATGIEGAVLAGSLNGKLKAFASDTGDVIWEFDTNRPFTSVNGVAGHGGALDNAGPVVGFGHMVIQSGYSYINQYPGNVLLVLKRKEK